MPEDDLQDAMRDLEWQEHRCRVIFLVLLIVLVAMTVLKCVVLLVRG